MFHLWLNYNNSEHNVYPCVIASNAPIYKVLFATKSNKHWPNCMPNKIFFDIFAALYIFFMYLCCMRLLIINSSTDYFFPHFVTGLQLSLQPTKTQNPNNYIIRLM